MCTHEPPEGFSTTDEPMDIWRVGFLYVWSDVFESWLDDRAMLSIKPGETGKEAYLREFGETLPHTDSVFWVDA